MTECLVCRTRRCVELVDFGQQPVCHHFFDGTQDEGRYPLVLGQCEHCGMVQLLRKIAPEELAPRFDWLKYNEPEGHIEDLVKLLRGLSGIDVNAAICGVSHKDESTLKRFRDQGFGNVWRVDPSADLGLNDPKQGIETIQQRLQPALAERLRNKYGLADLVIARHVLEHTHDTVGFMQALQGLVKPAGYVIIEVPDCAQPFELLDYTTLWEDHTLYFGEVTLRMCLETAGFAVRHVECFTAPYETAVVAIAQPKAKGGGSSPPPYNLGQERQRALRFAEALPSRRHALRQVLAGWKHKGKIALFGAGHHAVMFVNLLGVGDLIDFVLDDDAHKRGLSLPGSRLPIVGSERLMQDNVRLCLSSLGAGSEKKVIRNHQDFIQGGGSFAAIFPSRRDEPLTFLAGPKPSDVL